MTARPTHKQLIKWHTTFGGMKYEVWPATWAKDSYDQQRCFPPLVVRPGRWSLAWEDLRILAATLWTAGRIESFMSVLRHFNVTALILIPRDRYVEAYKLLQVEVNK